jgi:hypothetical protein
MKKKISLLTNIPALYSFLNADLPNGVAIISEPPIEKKDVSFDVNITITLTVDLAKISAIAFGIWLCKRSARIKGKHKVDINGKQIPIDQPEPEKLIAKEIEDKEQD